VALDPTAGTFDDLLALAAEEWRPVMTALRQLVRDVDPSTVEVVRLGDRAASYGVGPKKMTEAYAYVMPQAQWVNLGFYQGASLPDPDELLEGTGASLRHVKVRGMDFVTRPGLRSLLDVAVAERRRALGR
jgi:hypothetical protein